MKVLSITLHNLLSHADSRVEFNGTRLAAFVGPNGAGKSALLEALKYVLFDDARAKTDQLVRLGQTDMSASIEFEYSGSTYRAVRGRSTKGAGKTYLELHVKAPDGSWTPLTGDDIRTTQAAIGDLLGLDAETFSTAVFLGQGEADRFAEATAGQRKQILSTVLGLDVFARAEARAREEARDLEARTVAERSQVERLDDAIAELEPATRIRDEARERIAELEASVAGDRARRGALATRLQELAGEIAKGDAAAAEVARLEEERDGLADRYRRAKATVTTSTGAIAEAETVLATADQVTGAAARLPAARAEVDRLVEAEGVDRRLAVELERTRQAFNEADRPIRDAMATWSASLAAARRRVDELIVGVNALEPVVCRKCGTANVVDQAGLHDQLTAARAAAAELEAGEPQEPSTHRRDRVALARLEGKRRELGWDPRPLVEARTALASLERDAARGEAMEAAERSRVVAVKARAEAEAELARIQAAGESCAQRIATAKAATTGTRALLAEQLEAAAEARSIDEAIELVERHLRQAEGVLATAVANLERREQLQGQRAALATGLAAADIDLARLRRLVVAFGVTGIPARIIEGVLPELASYANELLGELRPGMTLELRAQRAKKDGKGVVEALDLVVRDDVGERSLALFSGGERMSVSLAIAVGLSRLVARRAGSAIRSLVIDEPDGLDADARRAFGQALRVLAHHGDLERVVLVSHHPDLAEYADTVWSVSKSGSGSVVTEAA